MTQTSLDNLIQEIEDLPEEACLDDALSGLEVELGAKDCDCHWHSETTGL
jgi:hypothetical protein